MEDISQAINLKDPDLLSHEDVERLLPILPELIEWATKVQDYALAKAISGEKFKGFKVVEGKSYAKVKDEDALVDAIANYVAAPFSTEPAGAHERRIADVKALCYERKLVSLTALKSYVAKKDWDSICGKYVEKPQGKPTLVPESDKRPEMATAASDFMDGYSEQ